MSWTIDQTTAEPVSSVNLSPESITISFQSTESNIDTWRDYDYSGDYTVNQYYAGGWELIDDQGRANTTSIDPPEDMKPPLDTINGYVQSYNEQQIAPNRYGIDLTIQRKTERTGTWPSPYNTGGDWQLSVQHASGTTIIPAGTTYTVEAGTTETYRTLEVNGTLIVNGTLLQTDNRALLSIDSKQVSWAGQRGTTTGGQWTLDIWVSDNQASAFIDGATVPNAVVRKSVGDGTDYVTDTSNDRQEITIDAPKGASLPGGTYLIQGWQLSKPKYGPRPWRINLTVVDQPGLYVPSGMTYVIESGDTETHSSVDVDGELVVNGTLIITD